MTLPRPFPPPELAEVSHAGWFCPDPALVAWMRHFFFEHDSPLHNPHHTHLRAADILALWTNAPAERKGRTIIGQAEIPRTSGDPWATARRMQQLREWRNLDIIPDFIITLYAPWCAQASDTEFCALVEHELYHCAQAVDEFGMPKFSKQTGDPLWTIRGHDIEEFVGVVERYGATSPDVQAIAKALQEAPTINGQHIAAACGTRAMAA